MCQNMNTSTQMIYDMHVEPKYDLAGLDLTAKMLCSKKLLDLMVLTVLVAWRPRLREMRVQLDCVGLSM